MNRPKNLVTLLLLALFLVAVCVVSAQGQPGASGQKEKAAKGKKEAPYAKPYPMGFVTIKLTSVGAGVGVEWGSGVLKYKGKKYTFKVKGIEMVSVGIASATAKGEVYNLFDIGEFPGQYAALQAGAAVIKGKTGQVYQNHKGVRILLDTKQTGLNFKIGTEGFYIQMEEAR